MLGGSNAALIAAPSAHNSRHSLASCILGCHVNNFCLNSDAKIEIHENDLKYKVICLLLYDGSSRTSKIKTSLSHINNGGPGCR